MDLPGLRKKVHDALDPRETIGRALGRRLRHPGWAPSDPLGPIMAAPDFPQPMFEALRDLSQEALLPGLGAVPPDTCGLLRRRGLPHSGRPRISTALARW